MHNSSEVTVLWVNCLGTLPALHAGAVCQHVTCKRNMSRPQTLLKGQIARTQEDSGEDVRIDRITFDKQLPFHPLHFQEASQCTCKCQPSSDSPQEDCCSVGITRTPYGRAVKRSVFSLQSLSVVSKIACFRLCI